MIPPAYTYLAVDIGCLAAPLLLSFYPRYQFYKQWRFFLLPGLVIALAFLVWDAWFTHLGVWGFNAAYTTGRFFAGMPLEEYLFFLCIPFAGTFTFYVFGLIFRFDFLKRVSRGFTALLACVLLLAAALNHNRLYTGLTFLFLAVALIFFVAKNVAWLPRFLCSYAFILIPFVLSNGVLTGSFFGRTVVWYNDAEHLGIRFLTIPLEDVFYGMLLLLLNVAGFEWLRNKKLSSSLTGLPAGL